MLRGLHKIGTVPDGFETASRKFSHVDCFRCCCVASIIVCAFACAGCGSKSPIARVRGKVELDGRPLATGAVVTLPKRGRGAQGAVRDGEFELGTFGKNDGALVGTHQVAVIAYDKSQARGPEAKMGKLLVPARYTNPETSGLSIDVKSGEVNTPTLELTSP